ncbi:MAG TPA: glycosyltransferase N-terminal domain-containing protein [Opitutaceae bacterium]|nr:glycosyltransferase N-terminal domain-containing protein [Opitutaceae bacterium]
MIWLYRILFPFVLLIASPFYLRRMVKRGGYRRNFGHRFGKILNLPEKQPGVKRVWLQAVSVGEVLAIGPLLEKLTASDKVEIYLTTTTSTGYKLARDTYGKFTVGIGYFPIDFVPFSARAWRAIQPDLVLLMEGERWPEHLAQATRRGVPVIAINARLSDCSFERMQRVSFLIPALFGSPQKILACSENDARRFRELGFESNRIVTTGNIKLDLTIPLLSPEQKEKLRTELGLIRGGMILLGSSTWAGEEVGLIQVLKAARSRGLNVSLLLVPRHAERREEIVGILAKSGLRYHLRSNGAAPGAVDIAVGDTTGELRKFTQLADLVFCGKSLAPHNGGQTPVEAAALGRPILFGPFMTNFKEISRSLLDGGAAREVLNHSELVAAGVELLTNPADREKMAEAARKWHKTNQGATERTLAVISEVLRG